MCLLLCLPGGARADDLASDLGGGFTAADDESAEPTQAPTNMAEADVLMGYVDADAAAPMSPVRCTNWGLVSVNQLIYESVVDLDDELRPVPMLADSWAQNDRYWRFTLRGGVLFHNGYSLTAEDVVRSWRALTAAGSGNPYYSRLQMITNMEATDTLTLTVEAKNASYLTLYAMVFPVMQSSTVGDENPRGTGPYWFIDRDDDGGIRLEANPLWWKRQPGLQSVLLKRYRDAADAVEALQTHQIEILSTRSSKAALCRRLADMTSMDYTTLTYEMLVPNLSDTSLMGDVNVRKAVMYAIDRSMLASNAYLDMAVPCEVPVPPSSWLYESQSAVYYYSPERALQLMNSIGWWDLTGDGRLNRRDGLRLAEPNLTLLTYNESTNSIRENAAMMIKSYLETVGFNVTVSVVSRARCQELIKEHRYDLALVGVNMSEVPTLSELLTKGGALNLNRYSNETMDEKLRGVAAASDPEILRALYSEIQLIITDRLPILGLMFRNGTVLSTRPIGALNGIRAYDNFNGFEFLE